MDYIGQEVLILLGIILSGALFYYAYSRRIPYSNEKNLNPSRLSDYALMLSCLLFIGIEVYLLYQYKIFGESYGIACFIPSLLFLFLAYFFDHKGVLSLSLTGFTSWVGISINPKDLLNPVSDDILITNASIAFGVFLTVAATILEKQNIKKHFTFTHYNFAAMTVLFYAISGVISSDLKIVYFLILLVSAGFFMHYGIKEKSKYFMFASIASLLTGSYFYFF